MCLFPCIVLFSETEIASGRERGMATREFHSDLIGEDEQFFDFREDLSSSSSPDIHGLSDSVHTCQRDHLFDFGTWVNCPCSVKERREKFMQWIGLDTPREAEDHCDPEIFIDEGVFVDDTGMRRSDSRYAASSMPKCSSDRMDTGFYSAEADKVDSWTNISDECAFDSFTDEVSSRCMSEDRSDYAVGRDLSCRSCSSVPSIHQRQDSTTSTSSSDSKSRNGRRLEWLTRLGVKSCFVNRQSEESDGNLSYSDHGGNGGIQRVKVQTHKKGLREFSAVFKGQNIKAHDGAILTMIFSPDGCYLATGGEDGIVRVWVVIECDRDDADFSTDNDPSCLYLKVNHNSALVPIFSEEKLRKSRSMKRTSDSACVICPSKVFRVSEEPLHVFRGHSGDVLDISWSKDKYILSSSIDKTVRLWQVGRESCLKIFSHTDYVTCAQFNPVDEKYFMSGSIDGKLRIWEISACRVVDWMDVKDIITAICYQPDGKGAVVGSMKGDCRFYDASENNLQLEALVSLRGKKKSSFNRITGFQFCPTDHRKLLVTSANSQVRIFDRVDVVSKFKGLASSGSQISASFTPDGKHIVSSGDDSYVYIWSHKNLNAPTSKQAKSISSYERFRSSNASLAIPWQGFKSTSQVSVPLQSASIRREQDLMGTRYRVEECDDIGKRTHFLSPAGSFTLGQEYLPDFLPRGSATWPEEKLPLVTQALCRSQFKFLKNSFHNTSHEWGRVIVTGGWDGRIQTFQNYGLPVDL